MQNENQRMEETPIFLAKTRSFSNQPKMAVLFSAKTLQYTSSKKNESFPFQNSLFLVDVSVPSTLRLLNRHGYPQNRILYSPFSHRRRRLALPFPSRPGLRPCLASKPGHPPSPPQSDPPPEPPRLSGAAASFSKIQDRIQIFFAVLFWMSLFFWTSALDERNRPNKGSRFRR